MLAGDALAPVQGWLGGAHGLAEGATPTTAATAAEARQRQRVAAKHLAEQPGYRWLLPSRGGNFSREQVAQLVQGWPDEAPQAAGAADAVASSASPATGSGAGAAAEEEGMQVSPAG